MATALLLCVGMLVIPLLALGASGGAAARATTVVAGRSRSRAAGSPRPALLATGTEADASVPAVPATLLEVEAAAVVRESPATFTTPLAAAAAAPAASATSAARASLLAKRPAAPTTTAAPHLVVKQTVVPAGPTGPPRLQQGVASWYYAPRGTCAHPTLPFGTVLTLLDLTTGRTATCRVDDRGPYAGGRIIDLAPDVFARLEGLGDGVAHVRIAW